MPTFPPAALEQFAAGLFAAAGVPAAHAATVARSLVDSNLCGHDSHGLIRVPQYVGFLKEGKLTKDSAYTVVTETPAMLAVDGHWGLGQVQAYAVLEKLWKKAGVVGVASGTLRRTGHIGRLGEYAEWAAARGGALFATVNSHGSGRRVAPPGGVQGRISTNPICFGAPTPAAPLVLGLQHQRVRRGQGPRRPPKRGGRPPRLDSKCGRRTPRPPRPTCMPTRPAPSSRSAASNSTRASASA